MNATMKALLVGIGTTLVVACAPGESESSNTQTPGAVSRSDTMVTSDPGIDIAVRQVSTSEADDVPVVLIHGARVPGVASFDLSVPGYSLAEDLVDAGHPTFVMDARGYGASTRQPAMEAEPSANQPLTRSHEVVADIAAVVEHAQRETGSYQVALLGWATGGHWAGMYAASNPSHVSHLVMYNSLYGATDGHPTLGRGGDNEDPDIPGAFNRSAGAYRLSSGPSLFTQWDSTIPSEDPSAWRDPLVADGFQREALASDPTSQEREPASFRAPTGATEDSFYLATGRQLWDASFVEANTLLIRSELDFWSRPADLDDLERHLVRAQQVRAVELAQATHYAHLDRPERGRTQFLAEVTEFLE